MYLTSSVTVLAALAALALTPISHGLRRVGEPPDETELVFHTPSVEGFNATWRGMALKMETLPWTEKVQLVLGVFSTAKESVYRSMIRETWARQPGVCVPGSKPQPGCSVYAIFVLGEPYEEPPEDDVLRLPMEENMDAGKSPSYFTHAVKQYPWATHYGKMDTDVFPHLTQIVQSIQATRPGCEAFLGKPWTCINEANGCPPPGCGPPQGGDFLKYDTLEWVHCWSYMQGGLYILSSQLAQSALANERWGRHSIGPEDLNAGRAVNEAILQSGVCVDTWRQDLVKGNTMYYHQTMEGLYSGSGRKWAFHVTRNHPGVGQKWCDFYGFGGCLEA